MDIWVALAAASVGYVAKHWQNVKRDVESSLELPSGDSKVVKPESPPPSEGPRCQKGCPLRRLARRKRQGEGVFTEREQAAQSASTLDGKIVNFTTYDDCNVLSISTLSPVYLQDEDQAVAERLRVNGNLFENTNGSDSFPEPPMTEMRTFYGCTKNKISLRRRQSNMQLVKPLTPHESCLLAQLYKERAAMDEYALSSVPLQYSPALRPFFVTDGGRIISGGSDSFSLQTESRKNNLPNQINSAENETVLGVPPLPFVRSLELPRVKVKTGKGLGRQLSSSSNMINAKHFHSLTGSSHGALLFGLGLSVGLISSFSANKREVEKLNDLLKQTENLVQDLHDELEMKDALTVKELALDDYESQDTCYRYNKSAANSSCSQQNCDGSTKYCGKELHNQNAEEDSDAVSKIEAELEAELERLELNMNSLSLERRLSGLVELDPDFIPDITRNELRPDMFGRQAYALPYADCDGSGTSTPHSANYTVSPRDLTLRLHEVIQSRLEERVKELETALANSQRKVQFMDSARKTHFSALSGSELRSSSNENAVEGRSVVINLSGEALDAYNEAYGEFSKMNESEEANTLAVFDQNGGESSPPLVSHEVWNLDEHLVWGDESENGHDDVEKLLIKQIVEKTRKGSSVIMNAGKELFSVEECEQ